MSYDRNGAPVEKPASDLANHFGKALYALSLLLACVLMPVGAVLTFMANMRGE